MVRGTISYLDVKTVSRTGNAATGYRNTVTFPRSYITREGGWRVPAGVNTADVLVVGGGGGGGAGGNTGWSGGGGGGGGVSFTKSAQVVPGSTVEVRVGQGGVSGWAVGDQIKRPHETTSTVPLGLARNGQGTKFGSISVLGGGAGGSAGSSAIAANVDGGTYFNTLMAGRAGNSGASGGGASMDSETTAAGTPGQGFAGGLSKLRTWPSGSNAANFSASGGGGFRGVGAGTVVGSLNGYGGTGGPGAELSMTGTSRFYGAGGSAIGCRGFGSTDWGATAIGTDGATNTGAGGGGGGSSCSVGYRQAGDGGSGVIVISYAEPGTATTAGNCQPEIYSATVSGQVYTFYEVTTLDACNLVLPTGVQNIDVFAVGGGGGGASNVGGGGGGGATAQRTFALTSSTISIDVGDGGAGGRNAVGFFHGVNGQPTNVSVPAGVAANLVAPAGLGGTSYFALGNVGAISGVGGAGGAAGTGGAAGGRGGTSAVSAFGTAGVDGPQTSLMGIQRAFGGGVGGSYWLAW
jgi:hypothetical protein